MYVLKLMMTADELNARVKNNLSEEDQKKFENTNFAVFDVTRNEAMGIELTMVAVAEDVHLEDMVHENEEQENETN